MSIPVIETSKVAPAAIIRPALAPAPVSTPTPVALAMREPWLRQPTLVDVDLTMFQDTDHSSVPIESRLDSGPTLLDNSESEKETLNSIEEVQLEPHKYIEDRISQAIRTQV